MQAASSLAQVKTLVLVVAWVFQLLSNHDAGGTRALHDLVAVRTGWRAGMLLGVGFPILACK